MKFRKLKVEMTILESSRAKIVKLEKWVDQRVESFNGKDYKSYIMDGKGFIMSKVNLKSQNISL